MTKLRVHAFAISLDGYGAGPDQSRDNPLGVGGPRCTEWFFTDPHVSADDRQGWRRDRRRRRFRARGVRQHRRLDPRPQHVRPGARAVAGRELEGLVGRHAAVSLRPSSCSPTMRARRSRWTAARPSTSSPTASRRRWPSARTRPPTARTSASAAASRRSGSTCARALHRRAAPGAIRRFCSDGKRHLEGIDLPALGYACSEHARGEGVARRARSGGGNRPPADLRSFPPVSLLSA